MDQQIQFFIEDIKEPVLDYDKIKNWLSLLIQTHRFDLIELNYILCSDTYLLQINQEHLQHDYYTDIITFDNSDAPNTIESDIFVSIERITDNARKFNQELGTEILRVLSHGILHLLGFNDKSDADCIEMRKQEELAIELYNKN